MIKYTIVLLALISIAACKKQQKPNPQPVPYVDISKIEGKWFVSVFWNGENNGDIDVICYTNTFKITGNKVEEIMSINTTNGKNSTDYLHFEIGKQNSIWDSTDYPDDKFGIIALDIVNYNSLLFTDLDHNTGLILSKTPQLDQTVIDMYIATAKIENYKVPANTTLFANNSRCSDTEVYETFYLD